jgi:hypothetical protein
MSKENTYNGWTNYETWLVNIWVDNDEKLYFMKKHIINNHDWTNKACELSLLLQETFEKQADNTGLEVGLMSDLLNGALSAVNWYELAEHYITDFKDDE